MPTIAGLDIGFSKKRKTSGVGLYDGERLRLMRTMGGDVACAPILETQPYDMIVIDGPLLPDGRDQGAARKVESLFASGKFQKRCKPGHSDKSPIGLHLRHAAGCAADRLIGAVRVRSGAAFHRVRKGAIIEAFPNCFLGVCLPNDVYDPSLKLKRKKFDWLYERFTERKILLRATIPEVCFFQKELERETDHEHRAAIICVLTGLFVMRGDFVAVGDEKGGWFFLPPRALWADWAWKEAGRLSDEKGCMIDG